nr:Repair protein [uncultured bacterium]AIA14199.1 Repair protein [uncultured bacterium]
MPGTVQALEVPPAPKDIPVVDQTNTLSDEQKQSLAAKIAAERKATGNQVGILMIKSLDGEALEDYSIKVARGWGIGQKDRDSGVLLLVAKDDRKLRIEVGYGLEGALTDAQSGRIIRDRITPQFRQGNYYQGVDSGVDGIILAIHGEKDPNLKPEGATSSSGPKWSGMIEPIIFGLLFIPVWLGSILARTKSWWAGGVIGGVVGGIISIFAGFLFIGLAAIVGLALLGLIFDKIVSDNYKKAAKGDRDTPSWWAGGPWIGGGGSGGGGGGGFGGFSGGSFGGGGSSGSW